MDIFMTPQRTGAIYTSLSREYRYRASWSHERYRDGYIYEPIENRSNLYLVICREYRYMYTHRASWSYERYWDGYIYDPIEKRSYLYIVILYMQRVQIYRVSWSNERYRDGYIYCAADLICSCIQQFLICNLQENMSQLLDYFIVLLRLQ